MKWSLILLSLITFPALASGPDCEDCPKVKINCQGWTVFESGSGVCNEDGTVNWFFVEKCKPEKEECEAKCANATLCDGSDCPIFTPIKMETRTKCYKGRHYSYGYWKEVAFIYACADCHCVCAPNLYEDKTQHAILPGHGQH